MPKRASVDDDDRAGLPVTKRVHVDKQKDQKEDHPMLGYQIFAEPCAHETGSEEVGLHPRMEYQRQAQTLR